MFRGGNFKNSGRGGREWAILFGDWGVLAFRPRRRADRRVSSTDSPASAPGLTALPLWLQAIEPVVAAQLVSAASVIGHVARCRSSGTPSTGGGLPPCCIAGLIGVPVGTWLLPWISVAAFKLAVGLVLIAY